MNPRPEGGPEAAEQFVRRRLSLRHLRTLIALEQAASLSAAAELLHVTQPAVSKTLAEIEQGLGQTLFLRQGRGLRATALGERMGVLARKLEADLQRGGEDVAAMVRGAAGELLIGATNAALAHVLPEAMAQMKLAYPHITLSVRTHALRDLFQELRQGRLDLVVARVPQNDPPVDLESHCLVQQREVLVISAHHPLARARRVGWETLSEQTWIWPLPGTRSRALQERLWAQRAVPLPRNVIETGDLMLSLSLMRRMPCLTIMPLHAARLATQHGIGLILPLEADLGLADLTVWHLPEPPSEHLQHFKTLLQASADPAGTGLQA